MLSAYYALSILSCQHTMLSAYYALSILCWDVNLIIAHPSLAARSEPIYRQSGFAGLESILIAVLPCPYRQQRIHYLELFFIFHLHSAVCGLFLSVQIEHNKRE